MIYTVGYQGSRLERIAAVAAALEAVIVDVRGVPRSRNPLWNRANLERDFPRYEWRGETLGNYGKNLVTQAGLDWLASQTGNIILMCVEAAPGDCHRHHQIAMRLSVPVWHIYLAGNELVEAIELQRAIDANDDYTAEEPTWLLSA